MEMKDMLTQSLPLLEANVVGLERDVLGVVKGGGLAAAVVVAAGLLAGGHAVGVGRRKVAGGGGKVRVRILQVVVEGVHGGVGVPRRRHARHRLRLVRDLRRAVQAHQQPRHQADRAQLPKSIINHHQPFCSPFADRFDFTKFFIRNKFLCQSFCNCRHFAEQIYLHDLLETQAATNADGNLAVHVDY